MEITEVKVFPVREEKLKAFASVVFNDCFMVNDIKIIKGRDGFFISMPSRRKKNGKFKDVAHPLNNETRQMIEGRILEEYERVAGDAVGGAPRRKSKRPEPEAGAEPVKKAPEPETRTERPLEREEEGPEEAPVDQSLEEVAEHHLKDSFWST